MNILEITGEWFNISIERNECGLEQLYSRLFQSHCTMKLTEFGFEQRFTQDSIISKQTTHAPPTYALSKLSLDQP